jgi:hypothetical protein
MILRLLNWQGVAGIAASVALAILLILAKVETRHWKKQSAGFERLYQKEQAALAGTVANVRIAADRARAADLANAQRVAADQRTINERTAHDFEARLATARAAAQRLRIEAARPATDRRAGRAPLLPALSTSARSAAQSASSGRLPSATALIATEQAIQLDELIKWVRAQAKVDNNATAAPTSPRD